MIKRLFEVKRVFLIAIFVLLVDTGVGLHAQMPQQERMKRRIEQSIRANTQREPAPAEEESRLPEPKPAVMNVDVQMTLSKAEHKTFAEAKAAEVKKVVDGEPLWLHLKFKNRLGDYVVTTRDEADPEKLRYTLFFEIAPRGDINALYQYVIRFSKEDLAASEIKINLAPGVFGRNKSLPVFLMTTSGVKSGVWNNEFRLTNSVAVPRGLTDNLASSPLTLDFAGGTTKYRKMDAEYPSLILRGSTDLTKLPVAGTFYSDAISAKINEKLAAENIKPTRVYFSGDDWQELASFGANPSRIKKVFATFTYRRGEACFYGIAEVVESFDFMQSKFGEAEVRLQKDLPAPCAEI
jgi:hypothetical protein